ncbi:hypothetical protein [Streptomyces sp. NPDC047046]|uniref:hypothetical protein n=1 Tax=Streptomyces sp. NPDC047046 TaxID=3155378 RepID=UPI0033D2D4C5
MTERGKSGAAPPGRAGAVSAVEAEGYAPVPPQGGPLAPAPVVPPGPPASPAPPRRTALAEGLDRLRHGAGTEPGRLRLIGAGLALLLLAFGAASAWQVSGRAAAAHDVLHVSEPQVNTSALIYGELAAADTAATTEFLSTGEARADARERYTSSVAAVSENLAGAAADKTAASTGAVERINKQLPLYTAQIDTARVYNRSGVPLGGAWLRQASGVMQDTTLVQATRLREAESEQLASDYAAATPYPWIAIVLGVLVLAALGGAQYRDYRRTHRILNRGLVAAATAALALLAWIVAGHGVARADLRDSRESGVASVTALTDARIAALQARANENLSMVNRGAVLDKNGDDLYEAHFQQRFGQLAGTDGDGRGELLLRAEKLIVSDTGREALDRAMAELKQWSARHTNVRDKADASEYAEAARLVVGGEDPRAKENNTSTDAAFQKVDDALGKAIAAERADFIEAARSGVDAFSGLAIGGGALAVLGAFGALMGVGRRLSEYR